MTEKGLTSLTEIRVFNLRTLVSDVITFKNILSTSEVEQPESAQMRAIILPFVNDRCIMM